MSSLVDPYLVHEHFYEDAAAFCKKIKQEHVQATGGMKQAQVLKSLHNSV